MVSTVKRRIDYNRCEIHVKLFELNPCIKYQALWNNWRALFIKATYIPKALINTTCHKYRFVCCFFFTRTITGHVKTFNIFSSIRLSWSVCLSSNYHIILFFFVKKVFLFHFKSLTSFQVQHFFLPLQDIDNNLFSFWTKFSWLCLPDHKCSGNTANQKKRGMRFFLARFSRK